MKLTDYCLIARLLKQDIPEVTNCFATDPDAEIFDLDEGKSVVIAKTQEYGGRRIENYIENNKAATNAKKKYVMAVLGETSAEAWSEWGQFVAWGASKQELYDLYAEMYASSVIGDKSTRYLPQINRFLEQKFGKDNVR